MLICRYIVLLNRLRYKLLQEKSLLPSSCYEKPLKLYLSRKNAEWRQILNEKEVIQLLEQHGFQTVIMEELSVQRYSIMSTIVI